jgi:hypothetical protein
MISHEKKFIFAEITKTGSTSVCKALDMYVEPFWFRPNKKHWHLSKHKKQHGDEIFNSYFKFVFTRNPWDKMVSQFFYRKGHYIRKFGFTGNDKEIFAQFINKVYSQFKKKGRVRFTAMDPNQHTYILDENSNVMADFIGKYESLQTDFDTICDKIKIDRRLLPKRNKSRKRKTQNYTEFYDDDVKNKVGEMFTKDIDLLKYNFNND